MVELWFYSGRIGNTMFMYAFNRCVADTLQLQLQLPKGHEISTFPNIQKETANIIKADEKFTIYPEYKKNSKTIKNENDNMLWFIEKQFMGEITKSYDEILTIQKILITPDIRNKWILTMGNFEFGEQYLPFRNKIKEWFKYPEIDMSKFEFFKIHPDLGNTNYYKGIPFDGITDDDLVISLRLEDYTSQNNLNRLLVYDYFKIILESKKWNRVFIITNPGSIGHNNEYNWIKEFYPYDPIIVRCWDQVMSMAFGSQFKNIAISQSTYSWWVGFLSEANNVYYPIPKEGPFSFHDKKYTGVDLRIASPEFKYVDYESYTILPDEYYKKIDYMNKKWKD